MNGMLLNYRYIIGDAFCYLMSKYVALGTLCTQSSVVTALPDLGLYIQLPAGHSFIVEQE